jgi:ribonuclease D
METDSLITVETKRFEYVRGESSLNGLIRRLGSVRRIALDTEADSLHHYFEKVCLIQLSLVDEHYLIDPLAGLDLSDFSAALAAKPLILHGGDYDLRMLRASLGFRPQAEMFDTMIAAQLLGFEQIGLAALIERYFAVTIAKSGQKSDWSRRPLTEQQLSYAVNDTRYLEALADRLADELGALGRLEWHSESCRAMVDSTARDKMRESDDAWRIKGAGRMTPRQLAYLRELWNWRDEQARKADRPAFKIFDNQKIFELVAWAESHPGESLLQGFKLPRNIRDELLRSLERALARAVALTPAEWPERKRGERPEPLSADAQARLAALRADCNGIAAGLQIAAATLAPKAALEAIIRQRPGNVEEIMRCSGLLFWQAELVRDAAAKCLR